MAANVPDGAVRALVKSLTFTHVRPARNKGWKAVRIKTYETPAVAVAVATEAAVD